MADLYELEETRAYLVAQGVVRLGEGAPGAQPPCWLEPQEGAPEPVLDEADDAVVTLMYGPEIPRDWLEGTFLQEQVIEVRVRARTLPRAKLIHRQVRGQLEEKQNVFFGALRVEWSKQWRGFQVLASDETGYTTTQSFRIAARVKSLAGLPYAP